MKKEHLIIEALLFVSPASLSSSKIADILKVETKEATRIIEEYGQILQTRQTAFQLIKDPDGFRLGTKAEFFQYIELLVAPRETKLSYQALETLSVITFKQPITKQEIEKVRGINSDGIINTLYSRGLIKVVGVKKIAGNPKLYGISKDFFKYFGIKSMNELKNYLKSIEIDTARLDALLSEDREEGANILFEDTNQESFDFNDDEIKINETDADAGDAGDTGHTDANTDDGDDKYREDDDENKSKNENENENENGSSFDKKNSVEDDDRIHSDHSVEDGDRIPGDHSAKDGNFATPGTQIPEKEDIAALNDEAENEHSVVEALIEDDIKEKKEEF